MESSSSGRLGGAPLVAAWTPARRTAVIRLGDVLRVCIAVLVIANLGRIPLLSTGDREAPLLVNDLAVGFFVAAGAMATLARGSFRLDRVGLAALTFATVGAGSAVLAVARFGLTPFELAVSLAYLARWLLYLALYLVMVNVVRNVSAVWRTLESTVIAIAGFGIVQAIFLPGFAQMVYPDSRPVLDWDIQGHRLVSTILEPNIAGAMLMMILLVELAQISVGARVARWKPLVLVTALVLTLSRSAVVGLVFGVGVIVAVYGIPKRLLRAGAAVLILAIALLPKLIAFGAAYDKFGFDASAAQRLGAWAMAFRIVRDHPWIGVGFNTYHFVAERAYGISQTGVGTYSTDGGLLFAAAMTGLLGLGALLWTFGLVLRRCARVWRASNMSAEHRGIAIGTAASTVGICAHSTFVNSLFTTFVMEIMWVLFGLTFAIARNAADSAQAELLHSQVKEPREREASLRGDQPARRRSVL